jgi:hypothetical protein
MASMPQRAGRRMFIGDAAKAVGLTLAEIREIIEIQQLGRSLP